MLEFLETALFIVILTIIASAAWIIHYLLIDIPRKQKDILERFSPCVINQILLEYTVLPQVQQKQIAMGKMKDIFTEAGVILPGDTTIEAKISDTIYKRKCQAADIWIEELKADHVSEYDTAEMPVTPKEEEWIL